MNRLVGFTLILFVVVGLSPLLAYSQPTITIECPNENFGLPPFTGKTQTLLISSSEETEVASVDLTLRFVPGEHLVVTGVQGEGDFAGWGWIFGDNDFNPNTEGSGVSISGTTGGSATVGLISEPMITLIFDSHPNATPMGVLEEADPDHGFQEVGLAVGPPVEPIVISGEKALPVNLSLLTVVPSDLGVTIRWRTESEINNLGFDVYRSENIDGKFVKVNPAYIKGAGTDATPHDYKFVDENAVVGKTYYYYLEDISFSGERDRSHIIKVIIDISGKLKVTDLMKPATFALLQNFPNPFNPETWIPFHLATDVDVAIRIFDIRGQEVRTIHLGQMPTGYYDTRGKAVLWDGRDSYGQEVSSGIYFYSLTAGKFHATRKLTIIK
jgi:hypothetical protein